MPSEADRIPDWAAQESGFFASNKSTFALCSHDIKILKSDLGITHPDAMRAASDSPLPSNPFSAWSVTIPDFPSWRRTFRHCLASIHLRSTSESNSLHPAHSSLERQAPHSWVQSISTIRRPGIGAHGLEISSPCSSSLRRNNSTTEFEWVWPLRRNICCSCDRAVQPWSRQA